MNFYNCDIRTWFVLAFLTEFSSKVFKVLYFFKYFTESTSTAIIQHIVCVSSNNAMPFFFRIQLFYLCAIENILCVLRYDSMSSAV